jgi:hypothetical protein
MPVMKTRVLRTPFRHSRRRIARGHADRPEITQFVSWQRSTPPQTGLLVRLVRVLAH